MQVEHSHTRKDTTVAIAAGASTTDTIVCEEATVGSLQFPHAINGTEVTFQVSVNNSYWDDLRDEDGVALAALPVAADYCLRLPIELAGFPRFRIHLNANQAAARSIALFLRG
jgi:hypothetical protein